MTEERTHSLPSRLAVGTGMALLAILINAGPPTGIFFLLWWAGGDQNLDLAALISMLLGLCWMGFGGIPLLWRLLRRVHLAYWNDDIGRLED